MYLPSFPLGGSLRDSFLRSHRFATRLFRTWTFGMFDRITAWGHTTGMREYEKRKLTIFNQINVFQACLGLGIAIACLLGNYSHSFSTYFVLLLPSVACAAVLLLNRNRQYETALIIYFLLLPILTSAIYLRSMDFGFQLNFILYGILAVFFLQDIGLMLFSIGLSMVSYFVLSVLWKWYTFQLEIVSPGVYLFTQLVLITLIFYGLFLVKKENALFQSRILAKNKTLKNKHHEIEMINLELADKAALLERQTQKLQELHSLKNKLFSIIAHDLKTPIHALRNVFTYMNDHKIPAREIKALMPDVVSELNNTTELMDNLLQWAKTQMAGTSIRPTTIDMTELTENILQLLRPRASVKQIIIEDRIMPGIFAAADPDMVHLIFRNLVSNAIKYTPANGTITVEAVMEENHIEILIRDTGVGMTPETLDRINSGNFFTTKGTNEEGGTGLGLMLCREFVSKNGGELRVVSQPGVGSVFSFTLVRSKEVVHRLRAV